MTEQCSRCGRPVSPTCCTDIEILRGLEPVRRRPEMYIGPVGDGSGILELIWILVENVVVKHRAGTASELSVDLIVKEQELPCVLVVDDGEGMPVEHAAVLLTQLFCGEGGPHMAWARLAIANALSARFDVMIHHGNRLWQFSYSRGEPRVNSPVESPSSGRGTVFEFIPDREIFGGTLDIAALGLRLQEVASLHPMLRVVFRGQRLEPRV